MNRTWLQWLTSDPVVGAVVLLNAVVVVASGFEHDPGLDALLLDLDIAFAAFFMVEALIKIYLTGWKAYWAYAPNRFDLALVVLSSPVLLLPFPLMFAPRSEPLRFGSLMLLRLCRLFRLFRVVRLVPDSDRLWHGVKRALNASISVIIGLVIYNVILGIVASYLFAGVAPSHFGDPLLSMYTVFKVFTVEGWYEIPDAIAAEGEFGLAVLARLFFMFIVISGGIVGLSIANAIFVDEMVMDNTDRLEAEVKTLKQELRQQLDEMKQLMAKPDGG